MTKENYTVRYSTLTFLAFYLNGALGSGEYGDISIQDVKSEIYKGTVFTYLKNKLKDNIDISALSDEDQSELISEWKDMADSLDEGRKLCVDKNGICLLVAYLLEGIQRRVKR